MSVKFGIRLAAAAAIVAGVSSCDSPERREAKYLDRGEKLYQNGEFAKARLEFKNALTIKPTDAVALYRLGLVDEAQMDLVNAFGNYTHAKEQDPHYVPALLKIAEYFMKANHLDEAQQNLDAALAQKPDEAEAHALAAAIALRRGDRATTEKETREALQRDPKNVTAPLVLAELYQGSGETDQADAALVKGLEKNPANAALLAERLAIFQKANDTGKQEEILRALTAARPEDVDYRFKLATIYQSWGRIGDGEAVWRAGVAAAPSDWNMKRQLVLYLSEYKGLAPAEAEINGYLQNSPHSDFLYFWLADLYLRHKADDRAIALLEKVVEKDRLAPEGLNARNSLARIRFSLGDRSLADKLLDVVLNKDPSNREALLLRARLLFDQEDYPGAVGNLRQLLRAYPTDPTALQVLAEALLRQGHPGLAMDTLSQLIDIAPNDPGIQVRLAQIKHLTGDNLRAKELLARVTTANPDYAIAWEASARVAIETKDWKGADKAITRLAALPDQKNTADFLRAQTLEGSGKGDDALKSLEAVITAAPDSPLAGHAYPELAETAARLNRLDDATAFILAQKSPSPLAHLTLARIYMRQKNAEAAAVEYDKLLEAKAPAPAIYIERAQLYMAIKAPDKAVEVLKKGVEQLPGDIDLAVNLAQIEASIGRWADGIATLQALLARNPAADVAANNLASMIADYNYDDPDALETARRAADRFQQAEDPRLLDTVAWVYYRLDRLSEANVYMDRIARKGGATLPEMHYHFGAILLKAGKKQQAKAELEAALRTRGGSYPGEDDARKMLAGL